MNCHKVLTNPPQAVTNDTEKGFAMPRGITATRSRKSLQLLVLTASLIAGTAHAQSAELKEFIEHADHLELYGEAARRCSSSIRIEGRSALDSNDDCVVMMRNLKEVDETMKTALRLAKGQDYEKLSPKQKRSFSLATRKVSTAIDEIGAFVRRVSFFNE